MIHKLSSLLAFFFYISVLKHMIHKKIDENLF